MNNIDKLYSQKCLSCGYVRKADDNHPRHRCPSCNAGYLVANSKIEKEIERTKRTIEREKDVANGALEGLIGLTFYFLMAILGGAFSFRNIKLDFKDDPIVLISISLIYVAIVVPMGYWYYKKKVKICSKQEKLDLMKK